MDERAGWRKAGLVGGVALLVTALVLFANAYYDLAGGLQRLEDPGGSGPPGRRPLPADPQRLTDLHQHLEEMLVAQEERIGEAVIVIADRNAFVGLTLKPHPLDSDDLYEEEMMKDASIHVRAEEPRVVGVFMTTEPDQIAIIQEVRDAVAAGENISHHEHRLEQLTDLGGRRGSQYFTPGHP